jgi:hypothetical protein
MRNRVLASLVALSAVLAACDGSKSATGPGAQLTAADAAQLNAALYSATAASARQAVVPHGDRIAASTGTAGSTFASTVPCSPSGDVKLAGSWNVGFDTSVPSATVHVAGTATHEACAVKTQQGATFTLNGKPAINLTVDASTGAAGLTAFHATETGAFSWTNDGGSGDCSVNVTADLVAGTQNVKLSGTFCGFPVDQTVSANG